MSVSVVVVNVYEFFLSMSYMGLCSNVYSVGEWNERKGKEKESKLKTIKKKPVVDLVLFYQLLHIKIIAYKMQWFC